MSEQIGAASGAKPSTRPEDADLPATQWRRRFLGVVQRLEEVVARNRVLEIELADEERNHERALSLMEAALDERDELQEALGRAWSLIALELGGEMSRRAYLDLRTILEPHAKREAGR